MFNMHVISYPKKKDFKDLPKLFIMTLFGMKRRDLHRIYCEPKDSNEAEICIA